MVFQCAFWISGRFRNVSCPPFPTTGVPALEIARSPPELGKLLPIVYIGMATACQTKGMDLVSLRGGFFILARHRLPTVCSRFGVVAIRATHQPEWQLQDKVDEIAEADQHQHQRHFQKIKSQLLHPHDALLPAQRRILGFAALSAAAAHSYPIMKGATSADPP